MGQRGDNQPVVRSYGRDPLLQVVVYIPLLPGRNVIGSGDQEVIGSGDQDAASSPFRHRLSLAPGLQTPVERGAGMSFQRCGRRGYLPRSQPTRRELGLKQEGFEFLGWSEGLGRTVPHRHWFLRVLMTGKLWMQKFLICID
ncbi:hypothetical protein J6590_058570 [Homalodisca vitripennis]|nr:hypothetical protein J6590_058570 [Homalodisca vitripennis]